VFLLSHSYSLEAADGGVLPLQVDAMKVSVKEFKREYKKINIDNIEVSHKTAILSGGFLPLLS